MKKWIKRILLTIVISIGTYSLCVFGFFTYMFYQESKSIAVGMQNVEGARVNAERTAKIHEFASIIHLGTKYYEEGKYDKAIEQYKKALDEKENNLDEWMARCGLARTYAKVEQYELALQEVNWIISQNPRKEVMDEYIIRKQLLEKLIEGKKAVNVSNLDQTAYLVH